MIPLDIAVFPNTGKEPVYPFFKRLEALLKEDGFQFYLPDIVKPCFEKRGYHIDDFHYRSKDWIGKHTKMIFSIGGDGSFLQAAREMAEYPVILAGIHLGDLGFLNSISESDLKQKLQEVRDGAYEVESRVFLSSFIRHADGTETRLPDVLNDIVVGHDQIGKMARLGLWINGTYFQQYPADGLVISTPTGSTSYALSCGGPILHSGAENMLIVPICPHMIQNFSMVLPMEDTISVRLPERERKLHISLDGNGAYSIEKNEELHIQCCRKQIRFLRFPEQDFFHTISSRLFPKITCK